MLRKKERKERLTVTIDADLVAAGNRAVRAGDADSISGWVNDALAEREAKDRRKRALAEAITAYEAEHGVITDEDIAAQRRADREAAIVVRARRPTARKPGRRPRAA
jgi:hypothetical protein